MKYELICGDYTLELNKKVNEKLADGWELHGETFALPFDGNYRYYQAVIKKPIRQPSGMQNL